MPTLQNAHHEKLARIMATGKKPTTAMKECRPELKAPGANVQRTLKAHPEILRRRDEIIAANQGLPALKPALVAHVDRAWIRDRLQEIALRCLQAEPIFKDGVPIGQYRFDAANALRALEDLGKDLGMFVERKESGSPGSFATDEERQTARRQIEARLVKLGITRINRKQVDRLAPSRRPEPEAPATEAIAESAAEEKIDGPAPVPDGIVKNQGDA